MRDSEEPTPTLGEMLAAARRATARDGSAVWTERMLSELSGVSRPLISAIERDERLPSLGVLARLVRALPSPDGETRAAFLARLMAKWSEMQARRDGRRVGSDLDDGLQDDLRVAADDLALMVSRAGPSDRTKSPSLEDLSPWGPFIVVCGDRREAPPRTRADLFMDSGAVTDITFLPLFKAGLVSHILSDKVTVLMDGAFLERELGASSLLVVGGPAVNWAARLINPTSLFRFYVPPRWEQWDAELRAVAELDQRPMVRAFWAIAQSIRAARARRDPAESDAPDIDLELASVFLTSEERRLLDGAADLARALMRKGLPEHGLYTAEAIMNQFRLPGFRDPMDGQVHGQGGGEHLPCAMISVAVNPFAPAGSGRVAVLVCGTRGRDTAHALRVLAAEPARFAQHPLGGVIEIGRTDFIDWSSTQPPDWRWLTSPYTTARLLHNLQAARQRPVAARGEAFEGMSDAGIDRCVQLVGDLLGKRRD